MRLLLIAVLLVGCGTDAEVAENLPDAPGGQEESQLPPQSHEALQTWLAAGHYKQWACEPEPHPARPPGAHGANRICSNAVLSSSPSGAYPAGAASVKELWQNGRVTGFAVGVKLGGSDWYWYEAYGNSVIADGVNKRLCLDCHAGAPRDFVFTHVRE